MRSNAVAFRGHKQVVDAYEANDMAGWAICNGKPVDIMFAYEGDSVEEGAAMLSEVLRRMYEGSSSAAYTLRVYELPAKGKILSSTPYNRAFTFKLYMDEGDDFSPFESGRRHYAKEAEERITALQSQIDALKKQIEEAEDEGEGPGGVQGFLAGVMEDPMMKQLFVRAIAGVASKFIPGAAMPAAVAGVEVETETQYVLKPGQAEKVQAAIDILCTRDPDLGDHLQKLANIAVSKKDTFNMLIGMLNNF
jgi:hypothetical protein